MWEFKEHEVYIELIAEFNELNNLKYLYAKQRFESECGCMALEECKAFRDELEMGIESNIDMEKCWEELRERIEMSAK